MKCERCRTWARSLKEFVVDSLKVISLLSLRQVEKTEIELEKRPSRPVRRPCYETHLERRRKIMKKRIHSYYC
jgi:hypothetical protein